MQIATAPFESPVQRSSALHQVLEEIFLGSPLPLTNNNWVDNPNPKANTETYLPGLSGAAWGLIGASTVLVLGAVAAGFLLWPTQEPQGTLRVEVVP